jgi:hypothetical protein
MPICRRRRVFVGAWFLSKTDDEMLPPLPRPRYVLPSAGILLFLRQHRDRGFLLGWARDPVQGRISIQQDLTYTIPG